MYLLRSIRTKKIAAMFIAMITIISIMAASCLPVMADDVPHNFKYEAVTGGKMYFGKYLIMDENAKVPYATFTFSIKPGAAQSYDVNGRIFEVMPGTGTPTFSETPDAEFSPEDTLYKTKQQGKNIKDNSGEAVTDLVDLADGQAYARKEVMVDFGGCEYDEPGVYRYILSETKTGDEHPSIINDDLGDRVIDVYVVDENSSLKVSGYVLHTKDDTIKMGEENGTDGTDNEGKSQGYNNRYVTHDLTFTKEVSGKQASRDKYFAFTLKITNAIPGTVFPVSLDNADRQTGNSSATAPENREKINPASITAGKSGSVEQKFYLQHGQSIKINGIPDSARYEITEDEENFKPSVTVSGDDKDAVVSKNGAADTDTGITADTTVDFVNTVEGIVATDVIISIVPYILIAVVSGGILAYFALRKKKEEII